MAMTAFEPERTEPRMTPYGAPYRKPEGLAKTARAQALTGIRRFGMATASRRATPDYLVIGTKRGGTTSMARWLLDHPDVASLFPARETRKGTYYFDVNYGRGEAWYQSHFPTTTSLERRSAKTGRRTIVGEATPYYLHHPHAAIRARRLAPDTKVIALLRDPVDRAFSHWMERSRNGVETLSFADAVAAEAGRLDGEEERMLADPGYTSFAHQHFSYIDQGRYARGLERWMRAFPHEQLLVLRSEDLYEDPASTYSTVLDFLDMPAHTPAAFTAWNNKPKPEFDSGLRAELRSILAPDIADVERLLGRSMDWTD